MCVSVFTCYAFELDGECGTVLCEALREASESAFERLMATASVEQKVEDSNSKEE
jgi:hypothetical protein